MHHQTRGGSTTAPLFLVLGGVVGVVAEFAIDLVISYTVKTSSQSVYYFLGGLQGLLIGALIGGAAFLGRPRSYGLAAVAGLVALIAGIIGDLIARPVIWLLHDLPVNAHTFTDYFTHQTAISLLLNLVPIAAAAVLTAVGVSRTTRAPASPVPPQGYWNQPPPPYGPAQPGPGMGAPPYAPPGPGGPAPQGWQPPAGPGGPPPGPPGSGTG
ncbi:hypothetical protein [Actinoallomurus sp. CA-150999]|uniref:hypothetical protein n=1 Tax=Actinoallomurus sp. CA-150999 TaxID=3239887 RepID=UPI003D943D85